MITRALVDINVLLDVLAKREPFLNSAAQVWSASESGRIRGMVCADSFSTLYYLLRKAGGQRFAIKKLRLVDDIFEIIPLDAQIIRQAMDSPLPDFEDAIQYHSALRGRADCIITRDTKHFSKASLPVILPGNLAGILE